MIMHSVEVTRTGTVEKLCNMSMEIRRIYRVNNDCGQPYKLVFVKQLGNKYYFFNPHTLLEQTFHGSCSARETNLYLDKVAICEFSISNPSQVV